MNARVLRVLLVLSSLVVLVPARALAQATAGASSATAQAAAQEQGREHFARGVALYREGNFGGARVEFQRAYDIAPSYRILFNLAESAFELQDYAGAMAAFGRYLAEGGEHVPPPRRAEVEKSLRDLEQRVGRLELTSNVEGADVSVDGAHVGTTPLAAPIVVSVGRRAVSATLAGRIPVSKTVDVAGGDHTKVSLDLVLPEVTVVPDAPPAGVLAPPPPPAPASPRRRGGSMTPVWVGVAATGALTAASAISGIATVGANSKLDGDLGHFPGSATDIASARTEVHTYALMADIFGGCAIAGAGVTLYLGLTRRGGGKRPPRRPSSAPRAPASICRSESSQAHLHAGT